MPTRASLKDFRPLEGLVAAKLMLATNEAFSSSLLGQRLGRRFWGRCSRLPTRCRPMNHHAPAWFSARDPRVPPSFPRQLGRIQPRVCCNGGDNTVVVECAAHSSSSRAEFIYAEFVADVKPDSSYDVFADPCPPLGAALDSDSGREFLAHTSDDDPALDEIRKRAWGQQQVVYAGEIFARH